MNENKKNEWYQFFMVILWFSFTIQTVPPNYMVTQPKSIKNPAVTLAKNNKKAQNCILPPTHLPKNPQ